MIIGSMIVAPFESLTDRLQSGSSGHLPCRFFCKNRNLQAIDGFPRRVKLVLVCFAHLKRKQDSSINLYGA